MSRHLVLTGLVAATLAGATPANAAPADGLTVGVFLPTTLADGQQRFDFGEKLAAALGAATGGKATARNFARYADFSDALKTGKIDVAVVDAWIAAEAGDSMPTVALASLGGATKRRWVVSAKPGRTMASLLGKPLALTRGAGNADEKFVSNALFDGALVVDKAMKPTYAPSVESALKMWSVGQADSVIVPAPLAPSDGKVLFQSSALPIAAILVAKTRVESVKAALPKLGAVAPFDGFVAGGSDEVAALRRLISSGPAARPPVWAESPPVPLDAKSQVTLKGMSPVFPSFVEWVTPPKETPDD